MSGWAFNSHHRLMIVTAFGGSMTSLAAIGLGAVPVVTRTVLPELRRARSADYPTTLAVASGARLPGLLRWHVCLPWLNGDCADDAAHGHRLPRRAGLLTWAWELPCRRRPGAVSGSLGNTYTHPGALMVPAIAITVVIVGFNILGSGLRDALVVGEQ